MTKVKQYSLCAHTVTSGTVGHDAAVLYQCGPVITSSFA